MPLAAQGRPVRFSPDSAATGGDVEAATARRLGAAELDGLPADSIEAVVPLNPGIVPTPGGLSLRGGPPGSHATYLNGVDVSPGSRRVRLTPAPSSLGEIVTVTGPLPAPLAGSRSGAILLETRVPTFGRSAILSYESDRLVGSSLGVNRIEGHLAGATRRSRVRLAGMLTGRKSAEFGAGARQRPIFVPAGLDTLVAVAASPGDAASDTSFMRVYNFAVARGDCDEFRDSPNAEIADNFGASCNGDRTPGSAHSSYRLLGTADHEIGRASRLTVTTYRARESRRLFSYSDLYNRAGLFGRQDESRVHSLVISGALDARRGSGYRLGLSRQSDELVIGPLTPESETATWDPAGGFMVGGLDFRWDLESFPVDSSLVANYRANSPGSRRSPYVLEAPDQYTTTDAYREGSYALSGFVERGGPIGRLTLFREKRTVAFATGSWTVSRNAVFTAGGEYTRLDVASYDHALTSQVNSDVYKVRPIRGALFAEDRLSYGPLTFVGGVRFSFFSSRADRPAALDTARTAPGGTLNPGFGTYQPFPRIFSYSDADGQFTVDGVPLPLVRDVRDRRHSAWTPHFRASFAIGESSELRASLARHARMPDLQLVYAGMNTDLSITSVSHLFGTDLGLERGSAAELGFRHRLSAATSLDLVAFRNSATGVPVIRIEAVRDPTRNVPVDLSRVAGAGRERARGAELWLEHRTATLATVFGYTLLDASAGDAAAPWERPHTISAAVGYTAPSTVRRGLMRGAALWLSIRAASGLPYSPCPGSALSDEPCAGPSLPTARLPAFRQVDARFSRRIGGRGDNAVLYVDVRNVFNRRNLLRVFSATGSIENAEARGVAIGRARDEIGGEAGDNGALLPDGSVDVTFGGQGASGCTNWLGTRGDAAAPSCVALVRAEERYGNGDGIYSVSEQAAAAGARFDALRGLFHDAPRRIRVGLQVGL